VRRATRYWVRKLAALPLLLLAASLLIFSSVRILPGDPARLMAGMQADAQTVAAVRVRMGLDRPLAAQYLAFLRGAVHGDLGISTRSHKPVREEIAARFPYTLALTSVSYALAMIVGIAAGISPSVIAGRM
jgi:glutathione transport system permease protein